MTYSSSTVACRALVDWGLADTMALAEERLEPMEGGASTREFFRVHVEGDACVLMVTPPPDPALPQAKQATGIAPFLEVAELLRSADISVPRIHKSSQEHQALLVEDLGRNTLEDYLRTNPARRESIYEQIVDDLSAAQGRLRHLPETCCVRRRSFDAPLLRWEIEHFRQWALLARGRRLDPSEESLFRSCSNYLVKEITSWPTGFVHRDLQSRNLMVTSSSSQKERVTWIDFQDAMLGCRVYDLVALLTDSYQRLDPALIDGLIERYCAATESEPKEVKRQFALVTVQRKLKDAGRFVFFHEARGDSSYLPFVDPTLDTVAGSIRHLGGEGPLVRLEALLEKAR